MEKLQLKDLAEAVSQKLSTLMIHRVSLVAHTVKNLPKCSRSSGFDFWVGKIPWRREWHPTPVFLPGKFHVQRSLLGYSPWGCKELGMTE